MNKNNNIKKIIEKLKRNSALTIVEVLVSVILTSIVMLHGLVFFTATWRLSVESEDYNVVLNDVVSNLEKCISRAKESDVNSDDYVIQSRTLRNEYTVNYKLTKPNKTTAASDGFWVVISSAGWKYDGSVAKNVIKIKTAYNPNKWKG